MERGAQAREAAQRREAAGRMERQLREDRRANWMAGLRGPGSARGGRCHALLRFADNLFQNPHVYLS